MPFGSNSPFELNVLSRRDKLYSKNFAGIISSLGFSINNLAKLFIENPKEDIIPAKFLEYNLSLLDSTFNSNGELDPNGTNGQAIKIKTKWEEINKLSNYNGDVSRIDLQIYS